MPVTGARGGEVADHAPLLPAGPGVLLVHAAVRPLGDLEQQRRPVHDRRVREPHPLRRDALRRSQLLVQHRLGVRRAHRTADGERARRPYRRRLAVRRQGLRGLHHPAAHPARLVPPSRETACPAGMCSTTSPGRFSPPVVSSSTSHPIQPSVPVQASHTSGGLRGSTPTPSTRLSRSRTSTQSGTAAESPSSSRSPTRGRGRTRGRPHRRAGPGSGPRGCPRPPGAGCGSASRAPRSDRRWSRRRPPPPSPYAPWTPPCRWAAPPAPAVARRAGR